MRATVFWLLVGVGRTVIGSAASSTKDLTGYWSVEIPTKSGGPSALICLKFRSVTSHSAAFHEVRKLSWSEPYEKSVTVSVRGTTWIQPREAKSYPLEPNGALNFSTATSIFRYGEPQSVVSGFTQEAAQMVGRQRPCLYAFGGSDLQDTSVLRITCLPPDDPTASLNSVLGFGKPPQHVWPEIMETSKVKPVVFAKDAAKRCMVHGQHKFDRQGVSNPTATGYRIWLQLATTFSSFTEQDAANVQRDLSEYIGCPVSSLKLLSTSPGSVVLQFLLTGYPQGNRELMSRVAQMETEVHDALLTFGTFVVLFVEFVWWENFPSTEASNGLPAWSVTILLLSVSFFLCWVGYTIQCRRAVLTMEKEFTEGKGVYQRVPRRKAYDNDDITYNPISRQQT